MTTANFENKVFGLGMSRTGTSSLCEALNHLGIRTTHYPFDPTTHLDPADQREVAIT